MEETPGTNLKPGFNLETSATDELGNVVTYIYEDESPADYYNDQDAFFGRLIEEKETNTPVVGGVQTLRTTYAYNTYGQITSKTMPKGNVGAPDPAYSTTYSYYGSSESATDSCTAASYSQLGLLRSVAQPGVATITQVQDGAGNIVSRSEGRGTTCLGYDALGRQASMRAPDRGSPTTYTYDRDGRVTIVSDPTLPAPTTSSYDDLGRLSSSKDALSGASEQAVTHVYDEHGNVKTRTDKTGIYTYTVDELDRVTQLRDPALRVYAFSYDADGRLVQQDLPNATRALLSYDTADRLSAYRNQTSAGGPLSEQTYTYNARGEKLTADGPDGLWVYRYDSLGRLEQAHDPISGRTRRYALDLHSNRTEIRLNRGWDHAKSPNAWDADPLVNKSVTNNWTGDNASFAYTLQFGFPFAGTTYTQAYVSTNGFLTLGTSGGAATSIDLAATTLKAIAPYARDLTIPNPATNPGKGIFVEEPLNDSFVRIRWKAVVTGGTAAANFEVTLYPSGQIKFNYQTLPASGTARVGITPGNGVDFVAVPGFDRKTVPSNAQTVTFTAAAESLQTTYGYNALDQLTGGTGLSGISYSTDGEQTAITGPSPRGSWTFAYDGRGLMRTATSGSASTSWTLDGEGRVVKRLEGTSETRYRFAGSGDTPAWEEDASGAVTTTFVSGPAGLLSSYASGTPTFYLFDGHSDLVQTRDVGGSLIQSYSYDENGNVTSAQSPSRYGYTGRWQKERHPGSSLIRMGVRMYDPLTGRFTSGDPIQGGDRNAYLYAGANPVNNYDLDGRWCTPKCWAKKMWRKVKGAGKRVVRAARWIGGKIAGGTKWALRTIWRAASALGRAGWAIVRSIATAVWNVVVWAWYLAQIGFAFWDLMTATVAAIAFAAMGQWGFAAAAAAVAIAVYYLQFVPSIENYCQRYC